MIPEDLVASPSPCPEIERVALVGPEEAEEEEEVAAAAAVGEQEGEEERIEKFFELLRRIRKMKQDSRTRSSGGCKGERIKQGDDPSWKPKFVLEDFHVGATESMSGRDVDQNRFFMGVGKKRKVEEMMMITGVELQGRQNVEVRHKEQVSTELSLKLGL